jgi:hypothetical protein
MNTPNSSNNSNTTISPLATPKTSSKSYYVIISIFSITAIVFLITRVVEIIDSSFINPFHFPMMIVSSLAVGSLYITPPRTMALTVRRIGLTLFVSSFISFPFRCLILCPYSLLSYPFI